jgi:hypothetical protein
MNVRTRYMCLALFCCQPGTGVAEPSALPHIAITASAPSVSVSPKMSGRHMVDLPSLEFSFDVETSCGDDRFPESLFLNVADTRLAFDAEQLSDNQHSRIVLQVPSRQLAPIAVYDFCATVEDESAADDEPALPVPGIVLSEVTISAAASAHASLRCRNESEQVIAYVTRPLDLTLTCEAGVAADAAD